MLVITVREGELVEISHGGEVLRMKFDVKQFREKQKTRVCLEGPRTFDVKRVKGDLRKNPTVQRADTRHKSRDAAADDIAEPEPCPGCDGEGTFVTCCDDICGGRGRCMHGDGIAVCTACNGTGEV